MGEHMPGPGSHLQWNLQPLEPHAKLKDVFGAVLQMLEEREINLAMKWIEQLTASIGAATISVPLASIAVELRDFHRAQLTAPCPKLQLIQSLVSQSRTSGSLTTKLKAPAGKPTRKARPLIRDTVPRECAIRVPADGAITSPSHNLVAPMGVLTKPSLDVPPNDTCTSEKLERMNVSEYECSTTKGGVMPTLTDCMEFMSAESEGARRQISAPVDSDSAGRRLPVAYFTSAPVSVSPYPRQT